MRNTNRPEAPGTLIVPKRNYKSPDVVGIASSDGFCTIYMYGPNADSLYSSIQPILNSFPFLPGSYALKRYGKPGSPQVQIPMAGE